MTLPEGLTLSGQILVLIGGVLAAALGAGGGLRYFVEPILKRRHLRKVMATSLRLSCHELRLQMEEIRTALKPGNPSAEETRDALLKIPRNDFGGRADWLVKTGYLSMITAYKIAAFSSWMRIYQMAVLQALLTVKWDNFIPELFDKFDSYKISASRNTVLWYNYIDAIGERLVTTSGEHTGPLGFGEFCKRYHDDSEFLYFFDQVHMFIHFMGRKDQPWSTSYPKVLDDMVESLHDIEKLFDKNRENLLRRFEPKKRNRIASVGLSKYLNSASLLPLPERP
jgi:hypothetical protein